MFLHHWKVFHFVAEDLYVVFLQSCYYHYTRWVPWLGGLVATLVPHVVVSTKYEAVWTATCAMNVVQLRNSNSATSVARSTLVQSMCASITTDDTHLLLTNNTNCARGTDLDCGEEVLLYFSTIETREDVFKTCSNVVQLWTERNSSLENVV